MQEHNLSLNGLRGQLFNFFKKQKRSRPEISDPHLRTVLEESKTLRHGQSDITQQLYEMDALKPAAEAVINIQPKAEGFKLQIKREETRTVKALCASRDRKIRGLKACRDFQIKNKIGDRPVQSPNLWDTAMTMGACWFIEGLMGAGLFLADGMMDILPSIATGFTISAVNILTSCGIGFFTIRYFNHLKTFIRNAALAGFVCGTIMVLLLHFGAARSRAVGGHSEIFDFTHVSFLETFNYFSMALFVLGIFGSVIAIYKGIYGLSDSVPHYSQIHRDTHDAIHAEAEDLYSNGIERLQDLLETALQEVDAAYKRASEARTLYVRRWYDIRKATPLHNDSVYDTIASLKAVMEDAAGQESFKKQKNICVNYTDIDALHGFTLKPLSEQPDIAPETIDMSAVHADLQEAFAQACLAMDMAWQEFCTPAHEFSLDNNPFTFNNSGDTHETL